MYLNHFADDSPLACQKPYRIDPIVPNEVCQPRRLKHITFGFFFEGVHIPTVNAVSFRERLFASDDLLVFKIIQGFKESVNYLLTVRCLHNSVDLACASLNLAFNFCCRSVARHSRSESNVGLKSG